MLKKNILILLIITIFLISSCDEPNLEPAADDPAIGVWISAGETGDSPDGFWELYSEKQETGETLLFAKMIYDFGSDGDILDTCESTYENYPSEVDISKQLVIGTILMYNLEFSEAGIWKKGYIIDPSNGKLYYVGVTVEGSKLKMRGSLDKLGAFGENQIWLKSTMDVAVDAKTNKLTSQEVKDNL